MMPSLMPRKSATRLPSSSRDSKLSPIVSRRVRRKWPRFACVSCAPARRKMEAVLQKRRRKMKAKVNKELSRGLRVWDAAKYLGIPENSLNNLRSTGGGPPYIKIGRRILYDVRDLDAWIKAKKFKSTADYATAR